MAQKNISKYWNRLIRHRSTGVASSRLTKDEWTGSSGRKAESRAADFLKLQGFEIIARNWKRRDCEIDIVARRLRTEIIHFFEVKYRRTSKQGSGMNYITDKKLARLIYAAGRYAQENNYYLGFEIGVIEISGPEFKVASFLDSLDF